MPASGRDDFTQATKDEIAKRAGYRCSNPRCSKTTVGPSSEPTGTVSIGVACHIKGASRGGPRYDPSQSPENRASAENGIWLCADCGRLIDTDLANYPVEKLQDWKQQQERWARANLGKAASAPITEVAGTHVARGMGNVTALDIEGSAVIKPGTKSFAEGEGNVTATRISPGGKT